MWVWSGQPPPPPSTASPLHSTQLVPQPIRQSFPLPAYASAPRFPTPPFYSGLLCLVLPYRYFTTQIYDKFILRQKYFTTRPIYVSKRAQAQIAQCLLRALAPLQLHDASRKHLFHLYIFLKQNCHRGFISGFSPGAHLPHCGFFAMGLAGIVSWNMDSSIPAH